MRATQGPQKLENLGLDRHIERGGWFICNKQPGPVNQRHRDENALPLAAGELVGIVMNSGLWRGQAHLAHRGQHTLGDMLPGQTGAMCKKRLGNLAADTHYGIQGGHGLLKDHRDPLPADTTHVFLGERQKRPARERNAAGDARGGWQ